MVDMAIARPKIVVLGNHKGCSGKSTLAMHIIVALLKAGMRIASIDLDHEQRSLTRYIDNRRDWAKKAKIELDLPTHHCIGDSGPNDSQPNDDTAALVELLSSLERNHDLIVIDTPGGSGQLSLLAHSLADTLITPINDSFIDFDVIYNRGPAEDPAPTPSRYAQSVAAARAARKRVAGQPIDWIVVRNRLSPLGSRNERDVLKALHSIADMAGFRIVSGLRERLVYRELFPVGLTAFDSLEASVLGVRPSASHLHARHEVTGLIDSFNVVPQTGQAPHQPANTLEAPVAEDRHPSPSTQFGLADHVELESAKTTPKSKSRIPGAK
jgi:chromosome partitioning protein